MKNRDSGIYFNRNYLTTDFYNGFHGLFGPKIREIRFKNSLTGRFDTPYLIRQQMLGRVYA